MSRSWSAQQKFWIVRRIEERRVALTDVWETIAVDDEDFTSEQEACDEYDRRTAETYGTGHDEARITHGLFEVTALARKQPDREEIFAV
jgi:hypothetical protein